MTNLFLTSKKIVTQVLSVQQEPLEGLKLIVIPISFQRLAGLCIHTSSSERA